MEKYWRPFFTQLQSKESELHCTGLATHSLKLINPLVVLEVLSVNMIHLNLRSVSFSESTVLQNESFPATAAESHWSDWSHMPAAYTAHTVASTAYRCLPALIHLSVPMGCPRHRIGLFVPWLWGGPDSLFTPDSQNNLFLGTWKSDERG